MITDYTVVTEVAGDSVTREQVQRMYTRYNFARQYCTGRDVLEIACGSGQGLGYLAQTARRIVGSDYSGPLLKLTKQHYEDRIPLIQLDAQVLPLKGHSFDVAILFEAIYYLRDCESFVRECVRVLRPGGILLVCNPNKHLPDFNPSPHSHRYFSAYDFVRLLSPWGFQVECFGDCKVEYGHPVQRLLCFMKKMMVRLDLMPKTMAGKRLFKRIVFGKLVPLPPELTEDSAAFQLACDVDSSKPDRCHKVIFAVAKKTDR